MTAGADLIKERGGRLDVLINNAGITAGGPQMPTTVELDRVRAAVEINVIGVIRVTNAMLPLLRDSASPRIVNMSSSTGSLTLQTSGGETGPIAVAYAPSKSFVNAVTVQYAKELADTSILINAACPGFTATDLNSFRGVRTPSRRGDRHPARDPARRRPHRRVLRRRRRGAVVTCTGPRTTAHAHSREPATLQTSSDHEHETSGASAGTVMGQVVRVVASLQLVNRCCSNLRG